MSRFDTTIIELIESSNKNFKANPLNLGGFPGSGGGVGAPPGGYIGQLPQTRVAYDFEELATLDTAVSGSLLDNLNHIRYRLDNVEVASGILTVDDYDGNPSISPTNHITFSGATVIDLGGGHALISMSGGGGGLDTAAGDARYLKLDTSNDPLTAQLNVEPATPGDGGIYIETHGDAFSLDVEQLTSASDVTSPALLLLQYTDGAGSFNFNSQAIHGVRYDLSTGQFTSPWLTFETNGSGIAFEVDNAGHAYDNGDLLITEAPIDGLAYARKDGDWVVASGVASSGGTALTVMEADGSPIVTNVDTIIFSGAYVTDLGGGDALVTISGITQVDADIRYTKKITSVQTVAMTSADQSVTVNNQGGMNIIMLDLSGLTGTFRTLNINTRDIGTYITIIVSPGHATSYCFIGPGSGATLHGGSISFWPRRLQFDNQALTLRATSATNWEVVTEMDFPPHSEHQVTPTWSSSPQNDYVTGGSDKIVATATTVDINLTGMANGSPDCYVTLQSSTIGTKNIILKHQDSSSVSANRFRLPGAQDFVMAPGDAVMLQYAASGTAWIIVGSSSASTMQGLKVDPLLVAAATTGDVLTYNGTLLTLSAPTATASGLTVMDFDTVPTVTNVDTIIFSGFIVEDLGSGDVRVSASGLFGVSESYIDQTPDNGTYGLLAGSVNSSNALFTVAAGSYISGGLSVFLNGQYQTQGSSNDWTETSPAAGTFTFVTAPTTGDIVTAVYNKANSAASNADTVDGLHASSFALDGEWDSGWIARTETWTRTGNHVFTVIGDQTTVFRKGTKVRYKDGGSYEYGTVASSAFSSVTTVTLITTSDYAMAAVTITDTYISYIENPEGFPHWFSYAMTIGGFTGTPSQVSRFSVKGRSCEAYIYIEGTSNATTFTTTAPVAQAGGYTAFYQPARAINNSAATPLTPAAVLTNGTTALTFYIDWNANAWTNSATKGISLSFSYEF